MQERNTENIIDSALLDGLLAAHDGDMALLYLYELRFGDIDMEDAARQLCRTMSEIEAADEKLKRLQGYTVTAAPSKQKKERTALAGAQKQTTKKQEYIEPAEELPQYTTEEITRRSNGDPIFSGLQSECTKVIGHVLNGEDLKTLFGIYDYLSLPPEVIMELLNYCASVFDEKYGTGRRPSMRAIEKEAYRWAKQEILTFEQAEDYIRRQKERRTKLGSIKQLMGIKDRHLSKSETEYLNSWLDMGFEEEAISIAYDRTLITIGKFNWKYMNSILTNWHNASIHSVDEINARDGRRVKAPAAPASQSGTPDFNMDELRNAINKI